MSKILEQSLQIVLQEPATAIVVVVLLTGGLAGMSIRNMVEPVGADDECEPEERKLLTDGGEAGLMSKEADSESADDDLGGLGGLDEGDLGGLDDDFGEMEGGEMAGGGGNVDELDHRLDELENEVGSLSSTVNTVRNENEQISESVQEVEENVRKLLDIYEMVTRGVNPFADDAGGMGMGGGMGDGMDGGGSFGLFEEEDDDDIEEVSEDVTEADAEGFFDDELAGEEDDEELQDAFQENAGESEADATAGVEETFEDVEESETFDEPDEMFEEADSVDETLEKKDGVEEPLADDEFEGVEESDGAALDEETLEVEAQPETEVAAEEPKTVAKETETAVEADDAVETAGEQESVSTATGKPYIKTLPNGFAAELVVVEWLEFLVDEVGMLETTRAIDYYETIGWVTEDVADDLDAYLDAFDDTGRGTLSVEHHMQSLEYVDELTKSGDVS